MITFGLYGSGWRSEYFLRVAKFLPDLFKIDGVITRNLEKKAHFEKEFKVNVFTSFEDYSAVCEPDFIVESVNKAVSADITKKILLAGIPVLMETPAGKDMDTMIELFEMVKSGHKIQIAEQYPFHPLHQARKKMIENGLLGEINHVHVSFSHGYHGVALIRQFLGLNFENVRIKASSFGVKIAAGVSRTGIPTSDTVSENIQTIATLTFENGQTAVYNFEMNQHRSWVRTPLIQIKGSHGEIFNEQVKYLKDYETPVELPIKRINLGENQNVEGFGLKGILVGDTWMYRNPFQDSRLVDDEIAVAQCLINMAHYVKTGEGFYSFAQGCQDMYLGMKIEEAVKNSEEVAILTMPWALE